MTGGFAEDAGQEGASSGVASATIRVAPWCGTANTHGFGIFKCYVTHQGEIQELERSQVLVKPGSYCVIQNRIFVSLREVSLDVSTGARG